MSGAVVFQVRGECSTCLRACELEVAAAREPVRPRWMYGEVYAHDARCLVCMTEQSAFYGPGEFEQARRSAVYAAA